MFVLSSEDEQAPIDLGQDNLMDKWIFSFLWTSFPNISHSTTSSVSYLWTLKKTLKIGSICIKTGLKLQNNRAGCSSPQALITSFPLPQSIQVSVPNTVPYHSVFSNC